MFGDSPDIVGEGPISDLGDLEGWWDNRAIVAWSFALLGGFLLNITLLLAFLIRPSLRTISNRFVMNLTVSNLLVCTIMNPLLIMDTATGTSNDTVVNAPVGSICAISESAVAIVTTSSFLSVLLIAVDQYFAVVDPLHYRARVDKLKSGILIVSIWFISVIFGILAFFNPNPKSFLLSCISRNRSWSSNTISFDPVPESTVLTVLENNGTNRLNLSEIPDIIDSIESVRFDDDIDLIDNTTVMFNKFINGTLTYGFVYTIVYTIFAYLIPFIAVCWIYVSIYVAAHRNSERARRTGSRPILSSPSFVEEQNGISRLQRIQTDTIEDFRKLPKISSLSSIDETSETMQPTGQLSRRRSFSSSLELEAPSSPVEDQTSSGIVFTVGLQSICINDNTMSDNLYKNSCEPVINEDVDENSHQEQDTHSVRVEKSFALDQHEQISNDWISKNCVDESSDSEQEAHFECFENLDELGKQFSSPLCDYSSDLLKKSFKVSEKVKEKRSSIEICNESEQNEPVIESIGINDDQIDGHVLQVNANSKIPTSCETDPQIPTVSPSEVKLNRRLSMFANKDVLLNTCENNNSCNKTDTSSTATESSACLLTPIVTITPAPSKNDNLHRVPSVRSTSSYINSLKDRISNGSIFRHREETRAARISALVIVMGLICWSPYVILLIMKNLPRSTDRHLPHKYDVLAFSLLILAAYVSPVLFGYRSKRVKRELRRFFCFRKELSYKNNRSLMAKKVLKRRHSSNLSHFEMDHKYNIFNCVYGRNRWPKEKVQFVQVPDTALTVETCRSSFSSGASTQISSTSTEEC
ncbi:unnamed protein product [Xylocopa violacea]|uniref:G-protein coupled receptors family 1 profile domain-containing protein n=1 Tax=Xylocopa violacea TaxID=135666 RepID=A0ABP1PAK2_XYLVO